MVEGQRRVSVPVLSIDLILGSVEASHLVVELVLEGDSEIERLSNGECRTTEGDGNHLVLGINVVLLSLVVLAIAAQLDLSKVDDELHAMEGDRVL